MKRTLRLPILVVLLPLLTTGTMAQLPEKYAGYSENSFRSIPYGLFKPAGSSGKSYPLIVYLHGANDLVSRDMMWYQPSMQKDSILISKKPLTPSSFFSETNSRSFTYHQANPIAI